MTDFTILTESELTALVQSSGDDCDMVAVACAVKELRALRAEALALKLRPPMHCTTCEHHNEQLVDRINAMVAAVCDACKATPAFVASQKWPLDPPPPMTDEEFEVVIKQMDQRAAETEADIQAHIASKGG